MSQNVAVVLIVLGAALWTVWYWMPARGRRALAAWLVHGARRLGLREQGVQRLAAAVGGAPGCGSCESCGSCSAPGAADKAAARQAGVQEQKPVTVLRRH